VVVAEINPQFAKELREEKSGHRDKLHTIVADVSQEPAATEIVQKTIDRFGEPSILVNNAGSFFWGNVENTSINDWHRVIGVNLTGPFLLSKLVAPIFKKRKEGNIINISSLSGLRGNAMLVAYNSAKFGIIGLTKGLAMELGPYNIRVNAICPGDVETPMLENFFQRLSKELKVSIDEIKDKTISEIAMQRLAAPEEIAEVVVLLASSKTSFITGACIPVSGGKHGL
jgi:sorbitol-6-phosphate 2-dehydrogenase